MTHAHPKRSRQLGSEPPLRLRMRPSRVHGQVCCRFVWRGPATPPAEFKLARRCPCTWNLSCQRQQGARCQLRFTVGLRNRRRWISQVIGLYHDFFWFASFFFAWMQKISSMWLLFQNLGKFQNSDIGQSVLATSMQISPRVWFIIGHA
jgi:hypothetical protein